MNEPTWRQVLAVSFVLILTIAVLCGLVIAIVAALRQAWLEIGGMSQGNVIALLSVVLVILLVIWVGEQLATPNYPDGPEL